MDRKYYINKFFLGVMQSLSEPEKEKLKNELGSISEGEADLDFIKSIHEKYGDLAGSMRHGQTNILLESINKKLSFFVILVIIGLVISIISAIIALN